MNLKISKSNRILFIVVSLILITAAVTYLINYLNTPRFIEEKQTLYTYKCKSDVNYLVHLTPNVIYDELTLHEGKFYITEFIDYIKASFHFEIESTQSAEINGTYQITAIMEGYTGTKDQYKSIWEKKYSLLTPTNFSVNQQDMALDKNIYVNLKEYIAIAEEILKQSKINTNTKLRIEMTVNYGLSAGNSSVDNVASPTIEIPLDATWFEIIKSGVQDEPGMIEETNQVRLGAYNTIVFLLIMAIGLLAIFILYLFFFTISPAEIDLHKKSLNKIFKTYGNRLVALNSEIVDTNYKCCFVKSMDDLVRIADEVSKPIMYEFNFNAARINKFYVFDDSKAYVFALNLLDYYG